MKKIELIFLFTIIFCQMSFSQAKKPTIMVMPSEVWYVKNDYIQKFNDQGTEKIVPDFKKAFQNSTDLKLVISKINGMMADRGFPLKDLEATLKIIEQQSAEDNMTKSSSSGSTFSESPLDKLKTVAKADIIMELTWTINQTGPKNSVTFILEGKDAYTGKSIAQSSGTNDKSFASEIPVLLEEAVLAKIEDFNSRLQAHFQDMMENGREVSVRIKVFDNGSGLNLEKEYDGKELSEIIDNWMAANTKGHRYNNSDNSANFIQFEQVRIDLYKEGGNAMDTKAFVTQLKKYLNAPPYNIVCKVMTQGLGKATLVIGEK
ncbi:MAG: DUF6175 family protein [Bacteroidales bacterium]